VDADVHSGTVDVAVEEGEVALTPMSQRSSAPHRLVAGQGASIDRDGRISAIQDVDDRLAWVSGSLTWHDVPLQKVADDLERWFDVEVVLDTALTTRQVTARYSRDAGIASILQGLAAALGANVSNSGSLWRITGIAP
jgi:ferric-dicitrate binding protein FerR (iron transport regulator)